MKTLPFLLFVLNLGSPLFRVVQGDSDALKECEDLHRISIHDVPKAHAEYSNSKCSLHCFIDKEMISSDAISENYPCPADPSGICHNGKCQGSNSEVVEECGRVHHLDLRKFNTTGSAFSNNLCTLRCLIDGKEVSVNRVNEGAPCPSNSEGTCRSGACVTGPPGPTTQTPAPATKPTQTPKPITSKPKHTFTINQLNFTFVSGTFTETQSDIVASLCFEVEGKERCSFTPKYSASAKSISWNLTVPSDAMLLPKGTKLHITVRGSPALTLLDETLYLYPDFEEHVVLDTWTTGKAHERSEQRTLAYKGNTLDIKLDYNFTVY